MSSEDITLVPDQRIENGLTSPLVFQDDPLRFNCPTPQHRVGDPGPKTRELGAFIDEKMFIDRGRFFAAQNPDFRRYADCSSRQDPRNWTVNGTAATPSGDDDSDEDDEDDDEDDDDEGDTEVEGLVGGGSKSEIIANNNGSGSNLPSVTNGKAHTFVSGRDLLGKHGGEIGQLVLSNVSGGGDEDQRQEGLGKSQNSVTVAETDCEEYYSHYLQGADGASGHKVMVDSGCGFSGRKDAMYSTESGESLRNILSDPVTKLAAPVLKINVHIAK